MATAVKDRAKASTLIAMGLAVAVMGLYVASADDAPGAAVIGLLLMVAGVVLGLKAARGRLAKWAVRTGLAVGIVVAAFAAWLTHGTVVTASLFSQASEVPSVTGPASPPRYAGAIERAREYARAAVLEQNLPGVSVAVGAGGAVVWAEGFGWRDVVTRTPVTPDTRFNIGTAASGVTGAVGALGLANTGADAATEWSPEHVGEPEEDFPLFTLIRHIIFRPIGLDPAKPLAGNRATFYVPRSADDPRQGRRLMYMRDLACCAGGMAFYSTPTDLVRFAMETSQGPINGELAGGMVTSLIAERTHGIAIAVASNMAHAKTSALAERIRDAFVDVTR